MALLEPLTVTLALSGCAPDGSRFLLVNEVPRSGDFVDLESSLRR